MLHIEKKKKEEEEEEEEEKPIIVTYDLLSTPPPPLLTSSTTTTPKTPLKQEQSNKTFPIYRPIPRPFINNKLKEQTPLATSCVQNCRLCKLKLAKTNNEEELESLKARRKRKAEEEEEEEIIEVTPPSIFPSLRPQQQQPVIIPQQHQYVYANPTAYYPAIQAYAAPPQQPSRKMIKTIPVRVISNGYGGSGGIVGGGVDSVWAAPSYGQVFLSATPAIATTTEILQPQFNTQGLFIPPGASIVYNAPTSIQQPHNPAQPVSYYYVPYPTVQQPSFYSTNSE